MSRVGRRTFLLTAVMAGALRWGWPATAIAARAGSAFHWTQLRYSGTWDPTPGAAARFLAVLRRRTSVDAGYRRRLVEVSDPALYRAPFLYVSGRHPLPAWDDQALKRLRRYVEHGGFLFFDDASGFRDSDFARSVHEQVERLFPGRPLQPLPAEHAVFQSFYLIRDVPGRKLVSPFLYGIEIEDLTPVLLCQNHLAGAWEGDALGGYTYPCSPGGERQREMSFRLGINLVLYALTGNYKKDQVHIPFILKRRQR